MILPDHPDRESTAAAISSLARRFGLPIDPYSQDWEYEVADPSRFGDLLSAYRSGECDEDERFTLMEMLVQCVEHEDAASVEASAGWQAIAELIRANIRLHASTVRYWACLDEPDLENCFRVSGPMRRLWGDVQANLKYID